MSELLYLQEEKKGMTVLELEELYCKECDLYGKSDLEVHELDACWKCHEYRRTGKVE